MSESDPESTNRPLGAEAYAAIARVEGLQLTDAGRKRLESTKHLSRDERRAAVLRAYKASTRARK